ncbi:MAG: hypothetical protein N2V76_06755 [Methanophagales archaeon]|nr:hypothetical protein [Methanophagales archaeon]
MKIMKINKKGAVIGAVVGAVAGGIAGATNLPLVERITVMCVVGFILGIVIHLISK